MNLIVSEIKIPFSDHLYIGETTEDEYVDCRSCDGCRTAMTPIARVLNESGKVGLETGFCPKCGYTKRTRSLSPMSFSLHFSKKWLIKRNEQVKAEKYVFSKVKNYISLEGRVLDVGCGLGGSLLPFQAAGYDVFGIEPSEHRATLGRELIDGIQVGFAEDYLKNQDVGKFDLIYFFNVLQFLQNPFEALRLAVNKLTDNGLIYLRVGTFHKKANFFQYSHLPSLRNQLSVTSIVNALADWDMRIIYYQSDPMEVILKRKNSESPKLLQGFSPVSLMEIEAYARRTLKYNRLRLLGKANLDYAGRRISLMLKRPVHEILPVCFFHRKDKIPLIFK